MNLSQQQLKGFSLLELLLVLVLGAAIAFLGFHRYQLYQQDENIMAVQQNVNLLFQAANTYYRLNCRGSLKQNFTFDINDLKKAGLMPNLINTKIADITKDYQVGAQYLGTTQLTGKPIYQLFVTVTPNVPTASISWYKQLLNASSATFNQLTWQKLPSYNIQTTASGLWILGTGMRQFKEISSVSGDDCAY